MKNFTKIITRSLLHRLGFDGLRHQEKIPAPTGYPPDFSDLNKSICDATKPFTMTSPERVNALIDAVQYVVKNKIEGAMVECGVWKGGSTMAMAMTLKSLGVENRDLFLYDTFSGMTEPGDVDVSFRGESANDIFKKARISEDESHWALASLEEVKENVFSTGYPKDRFHFIKGRVEKTIPENIPKEIALLRLDTDWHESTKHELTHLFPLLKVSGVLIIDDYGYWQGSRKAVDEYILEKEICILLNRIDYTGRIAIKT